MIVGIDIDGTLTDFSGFIIANSRRYMKRTYNCTLVNPDGYNLDELYGLEILFNKKMKKEAVHYHVKQALKKYWNKYYLRYCLKYRTRKGAGKSVKALRRQGFKVYILSSRDRSYGKNIGAIIVRLTTRIQLSINGIFYDKIIFFQDDLMKCQFIFDKGIDYIVDDKPEIVKFVSDKGVKTFLFDAPYNKEIDQDKIIRINEWKKIVEIINEV